MFKLGDRIRVVKAMTSDKRDGLTATVVQIKKDKYSTKIVIGVRHDKKIGTHNCNGNCEEGYGWYYYEEEIEIAEITDWRAELK